MTEKIEVWTAIYWRFQSRRNATFTTEKDARDFITEGENNGEMAAEGIKRPDGSFYEFRGEF